MNHLEFDNHHLWHPYTHSDAAEPLLITSASGVYLHEASGRRIIDAISSWWVNLHGHKNTIINQAITDALDEIDHIMFAGFSHKKAIELCEMLLTVLPNRLQRFFFSDNGSTAVEVAIKMALQYFYNQGKVERNKIVVLKGSYHGDTFGAMSVSERSIFTAPFDAKMFDVLSLTPAQTLDDISEESFEDVFSKPNVAAFIFEPLIQGVNAMHIYSQEWLEKAIAVAQSYGVICIADEVMTGFGRTGKFFATDYLENQADVLCLSKGITGGVLPLGLTVATNEIYQAFTSNKKENTFYHGHSYTGNYIACAAAVASFTIMSQDNTWQSIKNIQDCHVQYKKKLEKNNKVINVRHLGTILAFDIKASEEKSYNHTIRDYLYNEFMKRDILLRPLGNTIYIIPPYIITSEELKKIYQAIDEILNLLPQELTTI